MGNQYKLLPYKVGPSTICEVLKDEKIFYPDILAHSENFPPAGSCDFKKGTYYIKNWHPNLSNVPPVFETGDYMVDCSVSLNEQVFQVIRLYGQILHYKNASPKFG